jgi:GT2 family glycosyltransferase
LPANYANEREFFENDFFIRANSHNSRANFSMNEFVIAITATHRRHTELARLLASLEKAGPQLGGVIVVDNADDAGAVVNNSRCNAHRIAPGENLGCGGGLALGEKTALEIFGERLTHVWILDDDAVVHPDTLRILLDEMEREHAALACPMIAGEHGRVGWFPGLLDAQKFRIVREPLTPPEFTARCGDAPVDFSWSTGVALLVTRRALDECGPHRGDFWVRGEDLEFSLRLTARHRGIFVPKTSVIHLPPAGGANSSDDEYLKHCALLQNICYVALRLRHGHRIARTLPGNFLRFFKTWPLQKAVPDALFAAWLGAIPGKPAGANGADHFRRRAG